MLRRVKIGYIKHSGFYPRGIQYYHVDVSDYAFKVHLAYLMGITGRLNKPIFGFNYFDLEPDESIRITDKGLWVDRTFHTPPSFNAY